jgi:hypothetical protein
MASVDRFFEQLPKKKNKDKRSYLRLVYRCSCCSTAQKRAHMALTDRQGEVLRSRDSAERELHAAARLEHGPGKCDARDDAPSEASESEVGGTPQAAQRAPSAGCATLASSSSGGASGGATLGAAASADELSDEHSDDDEARARAVDDGDDGNWCR